ncbi:DUF2782 domain-containing protein [Marinicella gelatinilytica]|uniref:DUF2782 domain-containing protein n=1 Tax=Marinicella gelatinilytica TaxID=2996017 RepID=UPI002260EB80|nr:DUF2782 domain-containing protein [Marinicella gelatinilytica]MCX7544933.1 DUF2782 domain-containing protein [Marinicella gelatinilytica]
MRLHVLIMILVLSGHAVAQSPQNQPENTLHHNAEKADSNILLDHVKADKPKDNQVSVIIKKDQIVEEYRHKGELIMVKVIPAEGVPYYIDPQVRNKRTGAHSDLINSGVEPVYWVIKRF